MASITGKIEFYTRPGSMDDRDLRIVVEQDFEIVREDDDHGLEQREDPEVAIYAGSMLLWAARPKEMSGWLKDLVEAKIRGQRDWGITRENIREAIAEEKEAREFYRAYGPGRI